MAGCPSMVTNIKCYITWRPLSLCPYTCVSAKGSWRRWGKGILFITKSVLSIYKPATQYGTFWPSRKLKRHQWWKTFHHFYLHLHNRGIRVTLKVNWLPLSCPAMYFSISGTQKDLRQYLMACIISGLHMDPASHANKNQPSVPTAFSFSAALLTQNQKVIAD